MNRKSDLIPKYAFTQFLGYYVQGGGAKKTSQRTAATTAQKAVGTKAVGTKGCTEQFS